MPLSELLLPLAAILGALQLVLLLLARWLGRPLRREVVAAGLLLPLGLLLPWLRGGSVLAPANVLAAVTPGIERLDVASKHRELNDTVYQLLPWELEVRHAFAARRLPLWSDLLEGGSSPWSNPQAQVLSPTAMLARALPVQHHLLACLALHLLVAVQGAWVAARRLGAGRGAALLAGLSFALGGGIVGWALFPISAAAAWTPWVVAGVVQLARRPNPRCFVALALVTAALLLAGHPETALGAVSLAALLGLWLRRRHRGETTAAGLGRFLAVAALGGLLGATLAAPHLLPFAHAAGRSLRAAERAERPAPSWRPDEGLPGLFAQGGWQIWKGPFTPLAFGDPYGSRFTGPWAWPLALSSYTGLLALAAALAALRGRQRRRALPLVIFWLAALLLASRMVAVEALLFRVPLLGLPELSRFLPIGSLALCLASGLGWETLRRSRRRGGLLLATVPLLPAAVFTPTAGVLAVAALVALAVLLARARPRLALAAALGAVLLDLVPWGRAQLPADVPDFFYPRSALLARVAELAAGGRAVGEGHLVYPSLLAVHGIADPRPHNPLAPLRQVRALDSAFGFSPNSENYFSAFGNVEHPLLDFLAVRVVLSNPYLEAKHRLVALPPTPGSTFLLLPNPRALPLWFLAPDVEVVAGAAVPSRLARLRDGRRVVLAAEEVGRWRPLPRSWSPAAVKPQRAAPGRLILSVGGAGERLLASSLPGPEGWHARAAGRRLAALTVNGAYLGVRVPPGVTRVELRYLPPGLLAGAALATLGATVLLGVALAGRAGAVPGLGRPR